MNKKRMLIIAAVCVVIIVAGALVITAVRREESSTSESVSAAENKENIDGADGQEETSESGDKTASSQDEEAEKNEDSKEESAEQDTKNIEADAADGNSAENNDTQESASVPDSGNEEQTADTGETEETQGPISFPYTVTGTSLTIENISSYDGIFLEDGSDQEVSGIAAMVLKNTGDVNVEYARITLTRDGEELQFEASDIPAGATVVVQEKNKAAYGSGTFTDCSGITAELDSFEMSEDKVSVEETEEGSLQVTNLTEEEIPCVRIFYKFYMEDQQSYVGGITYTAKLTNLGAGSSQTVTPSHYAAGSSQVLMVRTYDTAE